MLLHQVCEELAEAVVVRVREEFQGIDIVHGSRKCLWQSAEKFFSAVAFQGKEFLVSSDHVVGIYLHPGQFSLDEEDGRVQQAFQIVPAAEGEFRVGGAAAKPQ